MNGAPETPGEVEGAGGHRASVPAERPVAAGAFADVRLPDRRQRDDAAGDAGGVGERRGAGTRYLSTMKASKFVRTR